MNRIACVIFAFVLPAVATAARVETIDLRTVACDVLTITAEGVSVETDAGRQTIAHQDVSEVVLAPQAYAPQADPMRRRGRAALVTTCGDVLSITKSELAEGILSLNNSVVGDCEVDIGSVSAIYLPGKDERPDDIARTCRQMGIDSGPTDRLLVSQVEGGLLPVRGALRTINRELVSERSRRTENLPAGRHGMITFTWQGEDRTMPLKNVRAILLADVKRHQAPLAGQIVGADGTTIGFTAIRLNGDQATVESPVFGTLAVARRNVAAIRFVSRRVVHLAEIGPATVEERGLVTDALAHRRNLSVGGRPLRLDGVTYATGLGLHSFTELTYDIGGRFSMFVAVVGIDDAVRPNGNATLTILGDGRELIGPIVLTGEGSAVTVRCELSGVEQLTIRVGFGADELSVSDHVDLAGARLIK